MSDLPDDIKSALNAALAPLTARIEALETKALIAAHAETQSLVKSAHDKIDALHKDVAADFSWLKTDVARLGDHVTETVEGALHSSAGLALGAFVCILLGAGVLALAQHFGVVG